MRASILACSLGALAAAQSTPVTVQPPLSSTSALPLNFGLIVFPGFQALDVFGPLDVLNMYAGMYNSTMTLEAIAQRMDSATTVARMAFGEEMVVTTTYKDFLSSEKELGVLIVPGGIGTRWSVDEDIAFVKTMYPKVKYLLTVCTDATIAARAGVLDGRKATTNKASWKWATSTGPNVDWQHTARWVVDGNIWTSSAVSAGIDLMFAWVGHVYGADVAEYVSNLLEYERTTNSTDDPYAAIWS